jgi:hypothetical protein
MFLQQPYLNERLVRFLLSMTIKIILGKTSFDYKEFASACCFHNMLRFYGVIKCGSIDAQNQTMYEDVDMTLLEESQASHRALVCPFSQELPWFGAYPQ